MKRNSKSWAQSLIFVLIITLALPFGMMGFAETTETSIKKTAELMDNGVKLGSYIAELSEDKSSVKVEIEMEDDFTLTSAVVRVETTTPDAIVFEASADSIETTFEFEINNLDEFDIVVEVEATREEVVGVDFVVNEAKIVNAVNGAIHFEFTDEFQVFIKRNSLIGFAEAYFVDVVSFSDYLADDDTNSGSGNGRNKSDGLKANMTFLESYSDTAAHSKEIQYLLNNREGLSDDEVQAIIWNLLGKDNGVEDETLNEIIEGSKSFEQKPNDLFAVIMEPFKADSDGGTDGDTETNDFDKFITVIKLTDSAFNEIDVIETVNYEAVAQVSFDLENEDQNPGTGPADDNDNGGSNGSGNDADDDDEEEEEEEEESDDDSNDDTNVSDESEDDEDEDSGEVVVEDPDNDTDVESPSNNNSNTDKETDKKDKPKQNDESTESVIVVVEAPTPMGSSASVVTPVNVPVETEQTEDLEEVTEAETPRGNPGLDKLPKTGEIPPYAYYAAGTLLLGLGVGLRKKF